MMEKKDINDYHELIEQLTSKKENNMKITSQAFITFIKEVENVLSKIHQKNIKGDAINPGDDEWMASRDRLMRIKMGSENNFTYPINWSASEFLIIDELASRDNALEEHTKLREYQ